MSKRAREIEEAGNSFEASCWGKQAYSTFTLAKQSVKRIRRRDNYDGSGLNIYQCRYCNQFHLGRGLLKK